MALMLGDIVFCAASERSLLASESCKLQVTGMLNRMPESLDVYPNGQYQSEMAHDMIFILFVQLCLQCCCDLVPAAQT